MKLENILNSGKRFVSAGLLATSLTFLSCRDEINIINPIVTPTDPLTRINQDNTWITDITTGGIDDTATEINAYLVTNDYLPVHTVLPSINDSKVLYFISAKRRGR